VELIDLLTVLLPLYLLIPALLPNSFAVIFGGGKPMDFGKSWHGKRILGDGKTWRGFIGGAAIGLIIGVVELILSETYPWAQWDLPEYTVTLPVVLALSFGSLLGDIGGAFIKRRLGLARGEKAPILDQYDFVIGAFLLCILVDASWFSQNILSGDRWIGLLLFLIIVPILHRLFNIIGYKMGKKDVPW
jgi:CDP-2,3-bis-(O-geranylgeranyl)-sn-glycerol synthase